MKKYPTKKSVETPIKRMNIIDPNELLINVKQIQKESIISLVYSLDEAVVDIFRKLIKYMRMRIPDRENKAIKIYYDALNKDVIPILEVAIKKELGIPGLEEGELPNNIEEGEILKSREVNTEDYNANTDEKTTDIHIEFSLIPVIKDVAQDIIFENMKGGGKRKRNNANNSINTNNFLVLVYKRELNLFKDSEDYKEEYKILQNKLSKYENEEFLKMAFITLPKTSSFADMVALNSIGVDSISQEARKKYFSFKTRNNVTQRRRVKTIQSVLNNDHVFSTPQLKPKNVSEESNSLNKAVWAPKKASVPINTRRINRTGVA
jgi:hypothetical protein